MSVEEFNQIPHFLFDYIKKYAAESPERHRHDRC